MLLYAGLHETPLAPAMLVLDAAFIGLGGREAILAIQRIYSALEAATDEEGLKEASVVLETELSGALADAIMAVLIWGARRGGKSLRENFGLNLQDALQEVRPSSSGPFKTFRKKRKPAQPAKPIGESRPTHGTPKHDATAFNSARAWESAPDTIEARFNQQLI